MRKLSLILGLIIILSINSNSQTLFESGYFINESGKKKICLIKNIDWLNNPTNFEYKLSNSSHIQTATIDSIKEFAIDGVSKYVRATVDLDKSSDMLDELSTERNPIFEKKKLLLKVLIEGKASLYSYVKGNSRIFFFKTNNMDFNQLIYKRYLIDGKIRQNNLFRQQLYNHLKCQAISQKEIKTAKYHKNSLLQLFEKYNEYSQSDYHKFENQHRKDLFNLSVIASINSNNLYIKNLLTEEKTINLDNKINLKFGFETEFILPYNKNKWGIVIQPSYQHYSSDKLTQNNYGYDGAMDLTKIEYKSIELPIGLRHYLFLNNDSKIFVNILYELDFTSNSSILIDRGYSSIHNSLEVKSGTNLAFGVGFKYLNKLSVELRYKTERELLGEYLYWKSGFETFSLLLGYTIF